MIAFSLHNVRNTVAQRPFQWEGEVKIGENPNLAPFSILHRENAFTLRAFGSRCYPPFSYGADAPPKWEQIGPLIEDGLRQLIQRDTFKTFAEVQGWNLAASAETASGAVEDTPVEITVKYRDGYRNRPMIVPLKQIPILLINPEIIGIEVTRAPETA